MGLQTLQQNRTTRKRRTLVAHQAVILTLQLAFTLCNGFCDNNDPIIGLRGCIYTGHFIPLDSKLLIGCTKCDCDKNGALSCCRTDGRMIVPDTCIILVDDCKPIAVLRSDPTQPCDGPISMAG